MTFFTISFSFILLSNTYRFQFGVRPLSKMQKNFKDQKEQRRHTWLRSFCMFMAHFDVICKLLLKKNVSRHVLQFLFLTHRHVKDGFEKLDLTFNQMSEYFRDLCFPCFIDIAN